MRSLIFFFTLITVSSCSVFKPNQSQNPALNTAVEYRKDMLITVNGTTFEGMGVVEAAPTYNFHVESRGQLDMFLFSSCNREWMKERAWNVQKKVSSGLFGWGRKLKDQTKEVTFQYTPIEQIEKTYCPVFLAGADKDKGKHSWGFVDFRTLNMTLPARLECNGEIENSIGVGICQSRKGKTQVIEFAEEVIVSPDGSCELGLNRGKRFEFILPGNLCVYRFMRIKLPYLEFRLTTFGYDSIPIRQE